MTTAPVRDIGTVKDIHGFAIRVGVDHDSVTIGGAAYAMLGPEVRDEFAKLYMQADAEAKAWAAEQAALEAEDYPESRCLACRTHITLLGGMWTADDGTRCCHNTGTAPFVPHKPKEG